ncbi:MAG: hypothetical protein H7A33_06285 [Deltaproteobacteria bacterium]|nr:hypothetical protein [Deltaproteobacteria bacterium]
MKKSCLVMDVGSTKKAIIKASVLLNGTFGRASCGSEKSGPMASVEVFVRRALSVGSA